MFFLFKNIIYCGICFQKVIFVELDYRNLKYENI